MEGGRYGGTEGRRESGWEEVMEGRKGVGRHGQSKGGRDMMEGGREERRDRRTEGGM